MGCNSNHQTTDIHHGYECQSLYGLGHTVIQKLCLKLLKMVLQKTIGEYVTYLNLSIVKFVCWPNLGVSRFLFHVAVFKGFIGAGKMASALALGIVKGNVVAPSNVVMYDVVDACLKDMETHGFKIASSNEEVRFLLCVQYVPIINL